MTGEQLTIEAHTLARATDRPSSHHGAAHAAASVPERAALFCYALVRLGGFGTANEAAAMLIDDLRWLHWSSGPWKRASDCARLGLIAEVTDRPCRISGHRAMVWSINAAGRTTAADIVPYGLGYLYRPDGS